MNEQPSRPTTNERQYLHTYQAAALVPLLQALITAVIVAMLMYVIADSFGALDAAKPATISGVIALAVSWLYLNRHWFKLTSIELFFNMDLNHDGEIGDDHATRAPEITRIQLDTAERGHVRQSAMFDLPASPQQLATLAAGLLSGIPFSEKKWTPTKEGKPFSSTQFRDLQFAMLKNKLIERVNDNDPRQGFQLTREGEAVMKQYAPSPTPPSGGE